MTHINVTKIIGRLVLFALVASVAACGRSHKEPDAQDNGKLVVPDYRDESRPLFLTGSAEPTEYSGSFIVWNPSVTKDQMATVIEASRTYSTTFARQLQYERGEIIPLKREIMKLAVEKDAVQSEKNNALMPVRSEAASKWFTNRMAEPALAGLDDTDRAQARAVMDAVCEAALWKKAVSPAVTKNKYRSVPTPLALCRDVYKERGLLDSSVPACAPAESSVGKNYFACLWQQGVVKTNLFARYGARSGELSAIDPDALSTALAENIGLGDKIVRQMANVVVGAQTFDFRFPGQVAPINNNATLATASVDMIMSHFVRPLANTHADALGLISTRRSDRDPAVIPLADRVRDEIRIFMDQFNDAKFNEALLVTEGQGSQQGGATALTADPTPYASIFEVTDPQLDARLTDLSRRVLEAQTKMEERRKAGGSLIAGESCAAMLDNMTCRTKRALELQADAVQQDGVGLAMVSGTEIVLAPSEGGLLSLALDFGSRDNKVKQARVCLDLKSGEKVDKGRCQWPERFSQKEDLSGDFHSQLQVSFDPKSSRLAINFVAREFEELGLQEKQRQAGQVDFNLLGSEKLAGRKISFEIYPNVLDGVLSIYGGSGKIEQVGEAVLSVSVSLTSQIQVE